MKDHDILFELGEMPVRFTLDGKVAVLDAIHAVTGLDCPRPLWKRLTFEHPELLDHCESRSFQQEEEQLVVDVHGWEKIWTLLPEYLEEDC